MNQEIKSNKNERNSGVNRTTIIGVIIAIAVLGGVVWLASPSRERSGLAQPASYGTEGSRSGPDSPTNNAATVLQNADGALGAEETSFDFGTVSMAAGDVQHKFKIKNTGSGAVTINKMYTSCMCTTATLEIRGERFGPYGMPGHGFIPKIGQKINPNEEAIVEVVFDPAAHGPAGIGRIQRVVTIENDGAEPLELQFTAQVTP